MEAKVIGHASKCSLGWPGCFCNTLASRPKLSKPKRTDQRPCTQEEKATPAYAWGSAWTPKAGLCARMTNHPNTMRLLSRSHRMTQKQTSKVLFAFNDHQYIPHSGKMPETMCSSKSPN